MQCSYVRKKLHAWMDNELPPQENDVIKTHLDQCPACRAEAAAIRRVAASLEALPPLSAPVSLSQNILREYRTNLERQGMAEWWQGLTLAMRSAFCGAALAGLLCGAVLGTNIVSTNAGGQTDPYQTLYTSQGIVP